MQKFELVLANEKIKQYRLFAVLIILFNLLFLIGLVIGTEDFSTRKWCVICISIIAAGYIFEYARKKNFGYGMMAPAEVILTILYIKLEFWWLAAIVAVLSFLFIIAVRKMIVKISADSLNYPSFPKREIFWQELNNVILKDGLLTIDFRNNKLAQAKVINVENDQTIDEKEFNDFCQQQLASAGVIA